MKPTKHGTESDGWVAAFAPATVANFGSGFDAFAAAFAEVTRDGSRERKRALGDVVSVRRSKKRGVRVVGISGDGGRLPGEPSRNCAAVAASEVLRSFRSPFGLDLFLAKGLPLSSGLGSSAASAAAGAFAAALALDEAPVANALLTPALRGEHVADGSWHGDNVWASLLGGGLVVRSTRPAAITPLRTPSSIRWLVVHPAFELETRTARAVLPSTVTLGDAAAQAGTFGSFVAAWIRGDRAGIGAGLDDRLAVPHRESLVPGYARARAAALRAGAKGFTFAGAGPSVLAVTEPGDEEKVAFAIRRAFAKAGLESSALVCAAEPRGARAWHPNVFPGENL